MGKQAETLFKKKVKGLITKLPNSWWLIAQMLAICGVPDIIGVINGRFVALELKPNRKEAEKKHGRVRLQGHILMLIRNAGGYAEFCYPENWEEIHADLSRLAIASVPSPWR